MFWTFIFPILLATGLGIAFRNRLPEKAHVGLVRGLAGSDSIAKLLVRDSSLVVDILDDSTARRQLRTAGVSLLIVPRTADSVEYAFDPTRGESRTARMVVDESLQRNSGRKDPVQITERKVSEKGSRYIDFVIPGLLGMNLMGSGIWGLGFSIVTARTKRLLKRLMATPMRRSHFLLSYMFSRLSFLILEVIALVGFGHYVFGVPLRGSITALALICLIAALSFSALGLLIASRSRTMEGVQGLMNFVMLPMWIFSGVFFAASNFPKIAQPLIRLLPLTAVNDALRANMLEGVSLAGVGPELAIITGWGILSFVVALKIFRWR